MQQLIESRASTGSSNLKQSDLFDQYVKVLQALARKQPLLLILEDLHWADAGTIGLLFHLGRQLKGCRILVIGTYRSAEVALGRSGERHPLLPVVNECKQIFSDLEVEMDQAAGREFIDALIDSEPNQLGKEYRETLFQQTGGHPLFTIELLREMQENGVLIKDEDGRWVQGPDLKWDALPAKVEAVIGERIGRLPEEQKRTLTLASIEGEEFIAEVAAQLQNVENRAMVQILSGDLDKRHHLVRAQGIRRIKGRPLSTYRFRHVLFQKYLYNSLDAAERAYLHEEVGNALEKLYGENADEIAVHLVRHFREAGLLEKAVDYQYLAAEQARRVFANEAAIEHYRQVLALLNIISWREADLEKCESTRAKALENIGDVQTRIGKHGEARNSFQEAIGHIPKSDVIWQSRLYRKTAKTWEVQRSFKEALQAYKLADSVLGSEQEQHSGDWWYEWIEAQAARIWLHYWQAQLAEMQALVEKVRAAVEQYGNSAQRAKFYHGLAMLAFRRDRYVISDETIAHAQAALAASRESNNLASVSVSLFLLGFSLLWRGDLDEAEEQMQASLKLTEQTGDVVLQSRCLTYLTVLYRKRGDVEKVREYIPRCETVAAAGQMTEYLATAKANTAWLAWREGNLPETVTIARAAMETWQQLPAGHASAAFHWAALWPLIGVTVARRQISEAIDYVRALLAPPTQRPPEPLTTLLEKAINSWEGGEVKKTRTILRRALELAQETGYL